MTDLAAKLDPAALAERVEGLLRRRGRPEVSVGDIQALPGGISSLTYVVDVDDHGPGPRRLVVKVALPPGLAPVGNRDVLLQGRLLSALGALDGALVPGVVISDEGPPPLLVMDHVDGQAFEPATDDTGSDRDRPTADIVRARCLAAAAHLVHLQSLAPDLAGPDEPAVVSLGSEVRRWARLFATVDDQALATQAERVASTLTRDQPDERGPVLVHGDYRLGNLLFEETRLRAVIDWEIWSFGDPRLDLAWLIVQCHALHRPSARPPDARQRRTIEAIPSAEELVDAYRGAGGVVAERPGWFLALADFKAAATISVLIKQNRKRSTPDPILASRVPGVALTLDRAEERLQGPERSS